jgi:hypothetical protein
MGRGLGVLCALIEPHRYLAVCHHIEDVQSKGCACAVDPGLHPREVAHTQSEPGTLTAVRSM